MGRPLCKDGDVPEHSGGILHVGLNGRAFLTERFGYVENRCDGSYGYPDRVDGKPSTGAHPTSSKGDDVVSGIVCVR